MSLFQWDVLESDPGRYVVVGESCLVFVMGAIFCILAYTSILIESREVRASLSLLFLITGILWAVSLLSASTCFQSLALIFYASLSALLILLLIYCAFLMQFSDKFNYLKYVLSSLTFLTILTLFITLSSPNTSEYANQFTTILFSPVFLSFIICSSKVNAYLAML